MEIIIPQPKAAEIYYNTCAKIDQHNRDRQDTLCLERKFVTKDWSKRVNLSIFAIIVVDAWRAYSRFSQTIDGQVESQKEFYGHLAAELIDNQTERESRAGRLSDEFSVGIHNPAVDYATGQPRSGVDAHISPTKRKKKRKNPDSKGFSLQGRCQVCQKKTTWECSVCRENPTRNMWICHTKNGNRCFPIHMAKEHAA